MNWNKLEQITINRNARGQDPDALWSLFFLKVFSKIPTYVVLCDVPAYLAQNREWNTNIPALNWLTIGLGP